MPTRDYAIQPGTGSYTVSGFLGGDGRGLTLASGRSSALNRGADDDLLRLEVRDDVARAFANGQEVDRAQHPAIGLRPAKLNLSWWMFGPAADGDVEVRFTDFKVYELAP